MGGEELRRALQHYTTHTAPTLNFDSYSEQVYKIKRAYLPR
jgi:hypothetical protein